MKTFFTNLIGSSDEASHKRIIALISFLVLIAMVVIKAMGHDVDSDLIYVFAALTGGESVLTVIDKFSRS